MRRKIKKSIFGRPMNENLPNIKHLMLKEDTEASDNTSPMPPNKVMENPNFRKWFGKSKVVDRDGTPKVVYHGTQYPISAFDKDWIGIKYSADTIGFFFIDSEEIANYYATTTSYGTNVKQGGNIVPCYLSMQKPLKLHTSSDAINMWDTKLDSILKKLEKGSYDGVIITTDKAETMYVVFEPNQIKSIYNSGQFSTTTDNISEDLTYEYE